MPTRLAEVSSCAIKLSAIAAAIIFSAPALASPPPDANPDLHAWFDRQHAVSGAWCCNLEWRSTGDAYQVLIGGEWHQVTPDEIRDRSRRRPEPHRPSHRLVSAVRRRVFEDLLFRSWHFVLK